MEKQIIEKFGNKLRVRVCGILIEKGKILLVKHRSLGKDGTLWAPPGGGLHFGEHAEDCLQREFEEEAGIKVKVKKYLFTHEFLQPPLHAIELFFEVSRISGKVCTGIDPEMEADEQIITSVSFLSFDQIKNLDPDSLHYILRILENLNDLFYLEGYVKFEDFT
jgi:8-oxo-dGTP diphosphatase